MSGYEADDFEPCATDMPTGRAADVTGCTYLHTDPATKSDRERIRKAWAVARIAVRESDRDDAGARRRAFRQEVGTNVRSTSPFLLSLAAAAGEQLDVLLDLLHPGRHWPRYPALSCSPEMRFRRVRQPYPQSVVCTSSGDMEVLRRRSFRGLVSFMNSGRNWACLEIVGHSLEVEARIGPARLQTLFGILRVELDEPLSETLAAATMGRSIGDVVDHASLRGQPWPIIAVEAATTPNSGQTLIVETGSLAFRMPWVR